MREVKLSNGKGMQIGSLTGSQVKKFRESKLDGIDEVFHVAEMNGIPGDRAEEMAFSDLRAIHEATIAETFGIEKETKN